MEHFRFYFGYLFLELYLFSKGFSYLPVRGIWVSSFPLQLHDIAPPSYLIRSYQERMEIECPISGANHFYPFQLAAQSFLSSL